MTSENYRIVLNNEYKNNELSQEEFDNTLMNFAMLFHKEQLNIKIFNQQQRELIINSLKEWDQVKFEWNKLTYEDYVDKYHPNLKD